MSRLIRASDDLLEMFGTRTEDGRRLTAEWGAPIGYSVETGEDIYEPTFTAHEVEAASLDGPTFTPDEIDAVDEALRDAGLDTDTDLRTRVRAALREGETP
mgnify:CR=1